MELDKYEAFVKVMSTIRMTDKRVFVRPMNEGDLKEADKIMRLAFGTFLGMPDPMKFMGDASYVKPRYNADPSAAMIAEDHGGRILGSNFALNWGSVGIFGPLTVHPDYWDRGVAKQLVEETMKIFQRWGSKHLGLFTFAQSAKHVHLYQKFGYWPRYLTSIMSQNLTGLESEDRQNATKTSANTTYSVLPRGEKEMVRTECRALTNRIYRGLDLEKEVLSLEEQGLGDTILLRSTSNKKLIGFAVCHVGSGTEAGSGNCYVKFGAVEPAVNSVQHFSELLEAATDYAESQSISRLVAGVNTARHGAYKIMIERGFRTDMQGVVMDKPNEAGYNLPGIYVIDDWR